MATNMKTRVSALSAFVSILVLLGCNSSSPSGGQGAISHGSANSSQMIGAGSTFVYPIMSRWIDDYQRVHQGLQINYQSIGSGGGIQQLKKGLVDFGASDAALDDAQLKEMPPVVQIPETAGPVCITYNVPNLKQPLKLSAKSLAGIYLGTIKKWNDPTLRKDNPGVSLPNQNIIVVHRSDGSGTTNIFTTYLSQVSPDWNAKVHKGLAVSWPLGIGGKGSEGVTGVVKQNPGAIGYVELTFALENNLPTAQIQNKAGKFVAPSAAGASAAINAFQDQLSKDVRTPIVDPPASAPDAYPISGLTFILLRKDMPDPKKGSEVKNFVQYIITTGQDQTEALHYSRLPESLQAINRKLLDEVPAAAGASGMQ